MIIAQLEANKEVWSLEDNDGYIFIHYLINNHHTVIPLPVTMLERMSAWMRMERAGNV